MKKILVLLLPLLCISVSALDLKTTSNKVYKDYRGLGGAAPNGIVVLCGPDYKEYVVPVKEFPSDFRDIAAVKRMAAKIPDAQKKAQADAKKAKAEKQARDKEQKEKYARMKKMLNSKEIKEASEVKIQKTSTASSSKTSLKKK